MKITLISMYEGGLQPLGISTAAPYLIEAGYDVALLDGSVTAVTAGHCSEADVVAISIPLFEAISASVDFTERLRREGFLGWIICYGTYAWLNRELLLKGSVDGVILGDWEQPLLEFANCVADGRDPGSVAGLQLSRTQGYCAPFYARKSRRLLPIRSFLPPISAYEYGEATKRLGGRKIVGNIETARGCPYKCTYCSIFAAYGGKVSVIDSDAVLADIEQVVGMGAEHICFVDAEFLSAPRHSVEIVRRMHDRHPHLTFDFTSRCDLIASDPPRIKELVSLGAKFVTSAFEFPNQRVLDAVNKGFSVSTIVDAIRVCRSAGLDINPTFILFNPWINAADLDEFASFLSRYDLEDKVDPIQFQTRLWLYKQSPLLMRDDVKQLLIQENPFNFDWRHSDCTIERVFAEAQAGETSTSVKRCCLKC